MRTALLDLFIVLPGAQHPIQANRQFPSDCRFGDTVMFIPRQAKVLPMPGRITLLRLDGGLYQQPAHQRIALLGNVTQASLVRTGIFFWNQSEIAGQILAARETLPIPDRQYVPQRHNRTDSRMSHQALGISSFCCCLVYGLVQGGDALFQLVQQFQQILAPLLVPTRQRQGFQLPAAFL